MSSLASFRSSYRAARRLAQGEYLWEFAFKHSASAYYAIGFNPSDRQFFGVFVCAGAGAKTVELPTDKDETETLRSWLPPEAIAECTAAAIAAQVDE